MNRFLFAAVASTALSCTMLTTVKAAEPSASSLTDKFYEAMIEKCLALGTLTPEQVDGLPDDELKAVLRTCDTSKAAATPAPVAPIATAPVVRPRLQPIAVQPDPEPEAPVSGGRRRVGGGSRFGGVAPADGGDAGDGGGDGGSGGGRPPINIGNGGDGGGGGTPDAGGTGGGTTGPVAGTPTTGTPTTGTPATGTTPTQPKLTNIQQDAVIGSKLKPGEVVASEKSKDLGNGLKQTTTTLVTKDAQGNVRVTQQTTVKDKNGNTVGTPKTTNQNFTPADVAVLKGADPKAGKGIPHLAAPHALKRPTPLDAAKAKALEKFKLQTAGKVGGGQTAHVTCVKAPCPASVKPTSKLGDARAAALERFKQMQAAKHQPGKKVAEIKPHTTPVAKVATVPASGRKFGAAAVMKQRQIQHSHHVATAPTHTTHATPFRHTVPKLATVRRAVSHQVAHASSGKRRHG